jgi:hypothetical protein
MRTHARSGVIDQRPLADAFIQQTGSIACAVTDPRGMFKVRLEPTGKSSLSVSAPGYVTREIPFSEAGRIQLAEMPTFRPTATHATPAGLARVSPSVRPIFGERFGMALRGRQLQQNTTAVANGPTRTVSGLALPEVGADLRLCLGDTFLVAEASRVKANVNLAGLATQPSTQPSVEWSEYNFGAAWPITLMDHEALAMVGLSNQYISPSPANYGFTGTVYDHGQTRTGLLLGLEAGKRLGDWAITSSFRLVPIALFTSGTAPVSIDGLRWAQLGVSASRPIHDELDLEFTLARQFGSAGTVIGEASTALGAGIVYRPGRGTP